MKDFGKGVMRIPMAIQYHIAQVYIDSCLKLYAIKFYEFRKQLSKQTENDRYEILLLIEKMHYLLDAQVTRFNNELELKKKESEFANIY